MPSIGFAQSDSYNLSFYPDAWYNSVDGVRIGGFVLGEMEGEFKSGPHRLNAGIWLGTNFPDLPVSYYLSFTEPLPNSTDPQNEANIRIVSSIRTGFSQHTLSYNKRWQPGFDERQFKELSLNFSQEKMFDIDYRPYPQLWEQEWKSILGLTFRISENYAMGIFKLKAGIDQNLTSNSFTTTDLEVSQQFNFSKGFGLYLRGFTAYISDSSAPEYNYGRSYRPANEWLQKGISRAKGTVPNSLLDEGLVHISGGANLRGYTSQDFQELSTSNEPLNYQAVASLNAEIVFPNPVNGLLRDTIVEDLISFRSYAFGDIGHFYRNDYMQTPDIQSDIFQTNSDAGIGFQLSVNIPDYLGKDRGFALRYEVPFWLSDPENGENNYKFRSLIGVGAVISL